ncbi:helix-turn-helix domain-containing protein [Lichenifustis flavocetrariae]|uniref:Helix-turn-helix domain-containing protein n=1 Tax=Lichenifustis flavocetrariae TaxID=2949735 RepID=A0AA42CMS6_9HYPH|nr:helix-turn-helix domain-containing protein [Lichenifustis flavocetrariae]MCW6512828.1 helix-turn-helix domain-containing protein [Lichenifustis flavocetrariae]
MLKRSGRGREKLFGDGRPVPMDRNAKARLMVLARALMRRSEKGRAYGAITAKAYAVLERLLWGFHNARSGLCFPGYARIAEAAGCAPSTVGEAIHMLERAGLLTWVNRLARIKVYDPVIGWRKRVIRTSNAYSFADPGASTAPTSGQSRPVRSWICCKTDLPSGTPKQEISLTDAPRRRDLVQTKTPLDEALNRFKEAMQRRKPLSS